MIIANTPVFNQINKDECCGCEACAELCPMHCITMSEDEEGFLYPTIIENTCINCKKCVKVCPVVNSQKHNYKYKTYAGYSSSKEVVKTSASGGAFTMLAETFVELFDNDCYICGVAWNDDFSGCHHIISHGIEELNLLKSSKYIQSYKGNIFSRIEEILKQDKAVLFSGTPCEIAALKCYMNKEYDKLYTVDLVCQGPTSPKVMKEFKANIEKRYHSTIADVNMRYVHRTPWIPQWIRIRFSSGRIWLRIFYETEIGRAVHIMQRKSCYDCRFAGDYRNSDITIGDYHGADVTAEYYNEYGTSIIIINTGKGDNLFRKINEKKKILFPETYEKVVSSNPRIITSWSPHKFRYEYGKVFSSDGLSIATKNSWTLKHRLSLLIPYDIRLKLWAIRKKYRRK